MSLSKMLLIGILASVLIPSVAVADEIRHSFFIAGPTFTGIIDEEGREVWDSGKHKAHEVQVLTTNGQPIEGRPLK